MKKLYEHLERLELADRLEELEALNPERIYEDWIREQDKPAPLDPELIRRTQGWRR